MIQDEIQKNVDACSAEIDGHKHVCPVGQVDEEFDAEDPLNAENYEEDEEPKEIATNQEAVEAKDEERHAILDEK